MVILFFVFTPRTCTERNYFGLGTKPYGKTQEMASWLIKAHKTDINLLIHLPTRYMFSNVFTTDTYRAITREFIICNSISKTMGFLRCYKLRLAIVGSCMHKWIIIEVIPIVFMNSVCTVYAILRKTSVQSDIYRVLFPYEFFYLLIYFNSQTFWSQKFLFWLRINLTIKTLIIRNHDLTVRNAGNQLKNK